MAGNDRPSTGNDSAENNIQDKQAQAAAENLLGDAYKRPEQVTPAETFDPQKVADSMKYLTDLIAKYTAPDASGTSLFERMAKNAPDLYASASQMLKTVEEPAKQIAASFKTELKDPSEQQTAEIQMLMKKMQV